jgi:hypothetical protein
MKESDGDASKTLRMIGREIETGNGRDTRRFYQRKNVQKQKRTVHDDKNVWHQEELRFSQPMYIYETVGAAISVISS